MLKKVFYITTSDHYTTDTYTQSTTDVVEKCLQVCGLTVSWCLSVCLSVCLSQVAMKHIEKDKVAHWVEVN